MTSTFIRFVVPTVAILVIAGLVAACVVVPSATPVPPSAAPSLAPSATLTSQPAAAPTSAPSATPTVGPSATSVPATVAAPATTAVPVTIVAPLQPSPASLAGHWEGSISVAGQNLTARVDLTREGDVLKGTADFPQQNAMGLALQNASQQGNKVHFEVLPAPNTAVFDGEMLGPDQIQGTFTQSGFAGDFTLIRKQVATSEAVPYRQEEVKFANDDVILAGTLTLPQGAGPFPAVVLITGSGPENRDEEVFGFPIFRVLADGLTRKGIAVLRYDDRGVGGSSAGTAADTSETFAGDVAAAVQYLKGRSEVDPKHIGLLGHSEGGIIAPMVAVSSPDVSFIILMSGPGTPGSRIIEEQARLIAEANGTPTADLEQQMELQKRTIQAAITGQGWDQIKADLLARFKKAAAEMPEDQRKALGDIDAWAARNVDAQVQALQSPWMQFFLTHDPAPVLEQVKVPVLALFGGLDLQVPAEENRVAIEKALTEGGNKDFALKTFPDANHLYQEAVTGSPSEYAELKPEFVPGFLDTISSWILAHTAPAQ
jgi:pimeloyl-ACP methyl ester carboxylesterase